MKYVQLKEIVEIVRGVTFSKDEGTDQADENRYPVIRAGSIQNELLVNEDQIWVLKEKIKQNQLIRKNDIIMCTSSGSAELVGKCAISSGDVDVSFGAFCVGLRPITKKVIPSFIYHYLRSPAFRNWSKNAGGANIKNLRVSELADFEIPLPQLEEQKRIAAILDKADAIRQKRQQAIALADDFLRSVFLDMFGDPVTNPKGVDKKPLGKVFKLSSGNGLTAKEMDADGRYPVYGGNGISGSHSEFMFEEPQLIIGRVGVYCGAIHITEPRSWVTDNALYVKKYLCEVNFHYLAQLLEILNLNQFAGRAAQPLVSGSRIYPIEVILPPIEEQVMFEKIKNSFTNAFIKNVSSQAEIDRFFNTLSNQAFSGQL